MCYAHNFIIQTVFHLLVKYYNNRSDGNKSDIAACKFVIDIKFNYYNVIDNVRNDLCAAAADKL